jgi:hypothetical protein
MANTMGGKNSVEIPQQKSDLSNAAQEVAKRLKIIYEELGRFKEEINGNLVTLANKIINKEATETDKINFSLSLTEVKSQAIATLMQKMEKGEINKDEERKGEIIVNNFIDKLRKTVV